MISARSITLVLTVFIVNCSAFAQSSEFTSSQLTELQALRGERYYSGESFSRMKVLESEFIKADTVPASHEISDELAKKLAGPDASVVRVIIRKYNDYGDGPQSPDFRRGYSLNKNTLVLSDPLKGLSKPITFKGDYKDVFFTDSSLDPNSNESVRTGDIYKGARGSNHFRSEEVIQKVVLGFNVAGDLLIEPDASDYWITEDRTKFTSKNTYFASRPQSCKKVLKAQPPLIKNQTLLIK